MTQRRITLSDVAREARLHVTTISLALRNSPRLPPETRHRVHEIAERLGYRPDPLLQSLVAYRSNVMKRKNPPTLAYVTNWNTRLGWKQVTAHPAFFAGAEAKANELGFNLSHFWMSEPGMTHTRLSKIFQTRGIHGIVIASHMREVDVALRFDWNRFSAVKIDYLPHQPALHNVTNNQCSIIRIAMRRLIAAGYRRIGFVMHRGWDHSVDHLWTAGFLCEQANLPRNQRVPMLLFPQADPIENWMAESKSDVVAPSRSFNAWYETHRPEVIISKSSFVAPRLAELRLSVPQDVALVDLFLEQCDGSVAGVRQNHTVVGELAVEILAGQLHHGKYGVPDIPTTTFVEGTWLNGASCPMPESPAVAAG